VDDKVRRKFDVIFQEAHVIDFDLSQWDRRLRLVVVAGLVPGNFHGGRGPLHNVDFNGLQELVWRVSADGPQELESPNHHSQWVIMKFDVYEQLQADKILLAGFGPTPTLEIVCSDVAISELDAKIVDRVNPSWNKASSPLARPGFEDLLTLRKG
jgi:hypothetical protein